MKKIFAFLAVLGLLFGAAPAKQYHPMFGVGMGFDFINTSYSSGSNTDVGFNLNFGGAVPIYNSLYARAVLLGIRVGDNTHIQLGTGGAFDLMYFIPSRNIEPYAIGGLRLESISDYTEFTIEFGGGAQMKLKSAPIKPFGEIGIAIGVASGYSDRTSFGFSMAFGIMYGK